MLGAGADSFSDFGNGPGGGGEGGSEGSVHGKVSSGCFHVGLSASAAIVDGFALQTRHAEHIQLQHAQIGHTRIWRTCLCSPARTGPWPGNVDIM